MKLEEALELFRDHLLFKQMLTRQTAEAYLADVSEFKDYYAKQQGEVDVEAGKLSYKDISNFLAERSEAGISARSRARKTSAFRSFLSFLLQQKILADNFLGLLQSPKASLKLPEFLSEEEVMQIFDSLKKNQAKKTDAKGERDYLLFQYLYVLGLRISELAMLKVEDVDLFEGFVRVFGKGSKQRLLPLSGKLLRASKEYLAKHGARSSLALVAFGLGGGGAKDSHRIMFPANRGKAFSRAGLWKKVCRVVRKAGIKKHVSPHTFRHTCATQLIQNGADLRMVQELLGHSSLATTEIYTHLLSEDLRNHAKMYHPLYQ